jgi:hypothetical protein
LKAQQLTNAGIQRRIERAITALSAPLTDDERHNGWSDKAKMAIKKYLETLKISADTIDERALHPVRGLDAWGVHGGELFDEIIEIAAAIRKGSNP